MISECPHCGQRLRSGWVRCPRCRQLLPNKPANAPAAPVAAKPRPRWLIAVAATAGAALIAGVSVLISASWNTTARTAAATPDLRPRENARATQEPKPVDPIARGQVQSAEERRAGYAAYSGGDMTSALARFQAAVNANPQDAEARNNLGQVLVRQNRAADALPHFDEAIKIDPSKWAYRFNRARAYGLLSRWTEAVNEYRLATELFPGDYATHYNLGLVLMRLKQYPEAVTALEQAVTLAPSEASFLISLGTAYVGVAKPDRAKATFEQFLEVAPDDPEAARVKALIGALAAATRESPQ
jgi:tetratricopeptide (TPR) repeat protein